MSDFLDEVAEDCREAEADLGGLNMQWNGADYPVAPTLIRRGAVLVIGGKEVEIKLTLRVRWNGVRNGRVWEFDDEEDGGMPRSGDRVQFRGKAYRVAQVNDAHSAFMELDLGEVNR